MSHQDGFGNNRSEPTGSTKPDDDNDGMQKKSENVAHAEDGIRLKKPKNSGNLRNSRPTPQAIDVSYDSVRGHRGQLGTFEKQGPMSRNLPLCTQPPRHQWERSERRVSRHFAPEPAMSYQTSPESSVQKALKPVVPCLTGTAVA